MTSGVKQREWVIKQFRSELSVLLLPSVCHTNTLHVTKVILVMAQHVIIQQRWERDGARLEHSTSNLIFFLLRFGVDFGPFSRRFSADFRCRISRGGMLQYRVSLYNKNDRSETVLTGSSGVTGSGCAGCHRNYCKANRSFPVIEKATGKKVCHFPHNQTLITPLQYCK